MTRVKKIPQRMCVGCGEMRDKKALIRVVRTPEGEIRLDPTGKKSGRGAYVCANTECLTKSIKGKRLEKALRHSIDPELLDTLKAQLGEV
ncbi:YlxR family protein [Heliobacterium chlorum]|uniref:YlxR family protein n=1 Tax=Heliobacterium chlorum TaxID=2698 RepID=A0ABR7T5I7_HELCL|nr:YlxR family protein [Heliobacterium chlorum]MBC9786043.1 YlxR family protein [Heliobacterium chlorum]